MGLPEKPYEVEGEMESEAMKWVISGIQFRSPLKPILTKLGKQLSDRGDGEEECSTTPTAEESRIPRLLTCPPAPKKRKPSSRCHCSGVREFFAPPDLETVFIRRVERA